MPELRVLACSVLRPEITALVAQGRFAHACTWYDSTLHMVPARLEETVESFLDLARSEGHPALLVCGECTPGMCELGERPGVARVHGCSCVELLVGHAERRRLLRAGAFCLLPEWIKRWEEVFGCTGLGRALSYDALRRSHRMLAYLDTGVMAVPISDLEACSAAIGLPYEIIPVNLDLLAANLAAAETRA